MALLQPFLSLPCLRRWLWRLIPRYNHSRVESLEPLFPTSSGLLRSSYRPSLLYLDNLVRQPSFLIGERGARDEDFFDYWILGTLIDRCSVGETARYRPASLVRYTY